MIHVDRLSKQYGSIKAVNQVSFEAEKGSTTVLVGTSGSGKTTTLKTINRLIEPTKGRVTIQGRDISLERPELLRRKIGYVSQNNGLFPHYTVRQNLAIVPNLLGWDAAKTLRESEMILEQLLIPMPEYGNKYPTELSGGQYQRVALARAMVTQPPVLLMDEPFGALDPITRQQIRKELRDLPGHGERTIILVTHDLAEAVELGDNIVVMDQGEVLQQGSSTALLFSPNGPFIKSFFDPQRFQLELSAIMLEQAGLLLPETSLDRLSPFKTNSLTVWDAISLIEKENLTSLIFALKSGSVREVTSQLLIKCASQIKATYGGI